MDSKVVSLMESLTGAWEMVEWSEIGSDGNKMFPLGEDALGQLMYTVDGRVSAQLVRVQRARFASGDWRQASPSEAARAFKEYFGYFGTFSVDAEPQAVTHHVKGAWFPNVESGDQVRFFRFVDGLLVLDADTSWGKVRIVWRRPNALNDEPIQVDFA